MLCSLINRFPFSMKKQGMEITISAGDGWIGGGTGCKLSLNLHQDYRNDFCFIFNIIDSEDVVRSPSISSIF